MSILGAVTSGGIWRTYAHICTAFAPMQLMLSEDAFTAWGADMLNAWLGNAGSLIEVMSGARPVMAVTSERGRWHDTNREDEVTCTVCLQEILYMCCWWGVTWRLWSAVHISLTWHISTTMADPIILLSPIMLDYEKHFVTRFRPGYSTCFGTTFRSFSRLFHVLAYILLRLRRKEICNKNINLPFSVLVLWHWHYTLYIWYNA